MVVEEWENPKAGFLFVTNSKEHNFDRLRLGKQLDKAITRLYCYDEEEDVWREVEILLKSPKKTPEG